MLLSLLFPVFTTHATDIHTGFTDAQSGHFQNFEYRVRLLSAEDGGVIGICLQIVNKSAKKRLVMRRPEGYPAVAISLYDSEGNDIFDDRVVEPPKDKAPAKSPGRKKQDLIEWKLDPLSSERYFVSLRDLLKTLPKAKRYTGCLLHVYVLTISSAVPPSFESPLPPQVFHDVIVTRDALETDATKAYKHALKRLNESERSK